MILTQSNIPVTLICQVRWSNIFHQHTCRVHHAGEPMFIWGSTSAPKHGTIPWHVIQFKHSAVWNLLYISCSLMTNNGCTNISIYIIYSISLTKFTLLTVRLWVKTHTNPYASTNNLPNVPAPKKDEKGTCKRGMRSCFPASQHLAISRWEKMGRSSELQHVVANWYPLVISNIAIENGHRNSGFSH